MREHLAVAGLIAGLLGLFAVTIDSATREERDESDLPSHFKDRSEPLDRWFDSVTRVVCYGSSHGLSCVQVVPMEMP